MNVVQISENTLVVLFEQAINLDIFKQVTAVTSAIEQPLSDYIIDIVPSYASIHILFDLHKIASGEFLEMVKAATLNASVQTASTPSQNIVDIPVYYGPEVGLDLDFISSSSGLSPDEVIKLHSNNIYDVYAMGFAPGFAYLGTVDERIAMPRKETPRKHIPAGSLGIADQQTAIYPSDSPGGWQIIGRTPEVLVDYKNEEPTKVKTGDQVRFVPISKDQYLELGGAL